MSSFDPKNKFKFVLLLANQRTGTGALGSVISQLPEVTYAEEVFHPGGIGSNPFNYYSFYLDLVKKDASRCLPDNFNSNLREYLLYIDKLSTKKTIVIDAKYDSTHALNGSFYSPATVPYLLQFFMSNKFPIIHHKRNNSLKSYVSGMLAQKNNVWHTADLKQIQHKKINIDINDFLNNLNYIEKTIAMFDSYLCGYGLTCNTYYEDIFGENRPQFGSIYLAAKFLGVSGDDIKKLSPGTIKQTNNDLSEVVINYKELKKTLEARGYERFLYV